MEPSPVLSSYPLSPAQQSLWTLNQLVDLGSSYAMPFGVRLLGNLNVRRLRQSCQIVVDHHLIP